MLQTGALDPIYNAHVYAITVVHNITGLPKEAHLVAKLHTFLHKNMHVSLQKFVQQNKSCEIANPLQYPYIFTDLAINT